MIKNEEIKVGDKIAYKDLPVGRMFHVGGLLCVKNSEIECFIFQTYNEAEITDPDAVVEVACSE